MDPGHQLADLNGNALAAVQAFVPDLHDFLIVVALSAFLFGVLTVLSVTSTYFLVQKGVRHRTVALLLAGTLILYASTTAYWAAVISNAIGVNLLAEDATAGLFDPSYFSQMAGHRSAVLKQSIVASISLAVNTLLGDAIVWWRAYVLWRTRFVFSLGCVLVAVTLALGVAGVAHDAIHSRPQVSVTLLYANAMGLAFPLVSLLTNVSATALIALKAWKHKRFTQAFLGKDGGNPEVMRIFILLIESGALYSALWIVIAIYQALSLRNSNLLFVDRLTLFMYGCLTPIIAIYPTLIIFLVALNRSQLEQHLSDDSTTPVSTGIGPFVTTTTSVDVFTRHQVELPILPLCAVSDNVKGGEIREM